MGYRPIPMLVPPSRMESRLDRERARYVDGYADLDEFEWRVAVLLRFGRDAEAWSPLDPPPKPGMLYSVRDQRYGYVL